MAVHHDRPRRRSGRRGRSDAPPTSTGALKQEASSKDGGRSARPIAVESAVARATTATSDFRSIGSLQSDESVQIASEIAGRVSGIAFTEGQSVEAGAELVRLDDALAQAEVSDVQARYGLAQANFDRAQALSRTGNVTGKAQDEAVANFEIARAAVELAKTRLSKHVIRAPFPGRVGIRKLSVGAYIPVGTSIVNLEKIDVLKVDFKLPEMFLPNIGVGQEIEINVDALPGRTFKGEIFAIDPLVDVNGRAIKVRARMENPGLVLRPGLFARILVKGQQSREVVMVPESAIVPRGGETPGYGQRADRAASAGNVVREHQDAHQRFSPSLETSTPTSSPANHASVPLAMIGNVRNESRACPARRAFATARHDTLAGRTSVIVAPTSSTVRHRGSSSPRRSLANSRPREKRSRMKLGHFWTWSWWNTPAGSSRIGIPARRRSHEKTVSPSIRSARNPPIRSNTSREQRSPLVGPNSTARSALPASHRSNFVRCSPRSSQDVPWQASAATTAPPSRSQAATSASTAPSRG